MGASALIGIALLASTGLYLAVFSGLRAPYLMIVLLHVGVGLLAIPLLIGYLWRHLKSVKLRRDTRRSALAGWLTAGLIVLCVGFGLSLIVTGATRPHTVELWLHQIGGWGLVVGLLLHLILLPGEQRRLAWRAAPLRWAARSAVVAFALMGFVDLGVSRMKEAGVAHADLTPADFSPSLATTASGGLLPADAFLDAQFCGQCHADSYAQWHQSAHRFASFNNPFYRKSVEYAADRVGHDPTKFCGACHDPLLLFSGRMDGPIDAATPEAQAGITCQVCHGITAIHDLRGNGGYTLAPPGQYPFAASASPILRRTHNLLVRLKPGPHREAMLKPLHTTPEFCSVCHKVHIPEAVNNFKWNRGQNEYDNWHHSGVSGNAVLSWGPPNPSPKICRDCHMPPIVSSDFGAKRRNMEGQGEDEPYTVRSHRFLAANTALPTINNHPEQLEATKKFLQDKKVSVEVIALDPLPLTLDPCYLPLNSCTVAPGQTVDLHVLVRNLGVGHTFPGGTIDSNEVWLEVIARDGAGRIFYHHGALEENGDVDPAAHFYKAVLLDRSAQLVNKRNVHDWVSTLYARTIPPGAADVARYRVTIPREAGGAVTVEVKLHYRKFMNWFSNFVFAGERAPKQTARIDRYVDESRWTFSDAPVPELPIVTMAEDRKTFQVDELSPSPLSSPPLRGRGEGEGVASARGALQLDPLPFTPYPLPSEVTQRLNSYGLGLLIQRDIKGAWAIFETINAQAPSFIEGHINSARTQISEGSLDEAEASLQKALAIDPAYPKALYLLGKIHRERGEYDQALALFQRVASRYPKDRVLGNEIAQIHFLQDRYQEAIVELGRVLAIDPENLAAHYYLMLSYKAIGDEQKAQDAQARYLRYKPDESITHLAGQHRLRHPEASLETQPVHVHE